jgi:transcriptional regulator with XRE-family HTH domain
VTEELNVSTAEQVVELLRNERLALGLTQAQVARKAAVNPATLSLLESKRNRPSVATLLAWASALGLSVKLVPGEAPTASVEEARVSADLRERTRQRVANGDARRIRAAAGVTLSAMVEVLGCSYSTLIESERQRRPVQSDALLCAYGRLLDALADGEPLRSPRPFGHDALGVRVHNTLRRKGIDAACAIRMSDAELVRTGGLGVSGIRRIQELRDAEATRDA